MSGFTIDQFAKQIKCESTSQCKYVRYGKGRCNSYRGYLIYSTSIGSQNEKYLFAEVKRCREEEILAQQNSSELQDICMPWFPSASLLFCQGLSKTCVNAFRIMDDQESEMNELRRRLGITD